MLLWTLSYQYLKIRLFLRQECHISQVKYVSTKVALSNTILIELCFKEFNHENIVEVSLINQLESYCGYLLCKYQLESYLKNFKTTSTTEPKLTWGSCQGHNGTDLTAAICQPHSSTILVQAWKTLILVSDQNKYCNRNEWIFKEFRFCAV